MMNEMNGLLLKTKEVLKKQKFQDGFLDILITKIFE